MLFDDEEYIAADIEDEDDYWMEGLSDDSTDAQNEFDFENRN